MSLRNLLTPALVMLLGCTENPLIPEPNMPPRAHAGPAQTLPFVGVPVTTQLDGSLSADMDGFIAEYRWFSATYPPTGGTTRYVPPGQPADWPPNGMRPMVTLPEGVWMFALQVVDNEGIASQPAYVTIAVGMPPPSAGAGGLPGNGGAPAPGTGAGSGGQPAAAGAGAGSGGQPAAPAAGNGGQSGGGGAAAMAGNGAGAGGGP